jgi:ABC-type transporter Mla subunit MlaD
MKSTRTHRLRLLAGLAACAIFVIAAAPGNGQGKGNTKDDTTVETEDDGGTTGQGWTWR